jgi:hypothetical protein
VYANFLTWCEILTSSFLLFCLVLILKIWRLCNVFGSGANHAIHAQFVTQSSLYNKGQLIGLLQGAGTWFATWFYAMHHALHLKRALLATIHQQKFLDLKSAKKQSVRMAVQDIEDNKFWKCLYILLCFVFPALRALCFCNASRPVMDKFSFFPTGPHKLLKGHRNSSMIQTSLVPLPWTTT